MQVCKDCNDRIIGCHITCEKYIKWRNDRDKINEMARKRREYDSITIKRKYQR